MSLTPKPSIIRLLTPNNPTMYFSEPCMPQKSRHFLLRTLQFIFFWTKIQKPTIIRHATIIRLLVVGVFFPLQMHLISETYDYSTFHPKTLQFIFRKRLCHQNSIIPPITTNYFSSQTHKSLRIFDFWPKKKNATIYFSEMAMQQNPNTSPWKPFDLFSNHSNIPICLRLFDKLRWLGFSSYFNECSCAIFKQKKRASRRKKK